MMQLKYIRIQGREIAWLTKKPVGIFALGWRKVRDNTFSEEDADIFRLAERWFVDNLPYPPFYGENNDDANANTFGAITFFKNNSCANEMLEHLTPMFELFDKRDIPYDIVYTNHVGTIIYEDDYQVGVIDAD